MRGGGKGNKKRKERQKNRQIGGKDTERARIQREGGKRKQTEKKTINFKRKKTRKKERK